MFICLHSRQSLLMMLLFCLLPATAVLAQTAEETLTTLFTDEWEARLAGNPGLAASMGDVEAAGRIIDVSPAAVAAQAQQDARFLERLAAISYEALSDESRLNYDLFKFILEDRVRAAARKAWRIPFLSDSGFHTALSGAVESTRADNEAQVEAYLRRLAAIPAHINQQIDNMRVGLRDGYTQPAAIMAKIEPSFAALAVDAVEESVFFSPFQRLSENIPDAQQAALTAQGREIIQSRVLPAFKTLYQFISQEYTPAARTTLGASDLPDGEAYYQSLIAYFTTLDLTAAEVHAIGQREAARIRAEMEAIIEEVEFAGTFAEFLSFLRTDPQFYAQSARELLMEAAWIAKRTDEVMPAFFKTLPRDPYGVRAVPDAIAPNYTTGRYWGGIPGVRGGLFMVNTYNLKERPLYTLPALALHEGVPGHHHQIALSKELKNVPEFRRRFYLSAFGEGWGLYCERLGEEMGIYENAYERFGRLTYEMWRAGRLIVDTGIHAMGWTRQQAVNFFLENSALAEHNINTEVDRYISWPGQALAYKIGELKIVELRQKAESALGDAFDIREFHDAILRNGTVPLGVMAHQVDRYIATASK
ncbi:MAG: DUF885 family protein [Bacteroidota bacterium]